MLYKNSDNIINHKEASKSIHVYKFYKLVFFIFFNFFVLLGQFI